jgi:carbamoyl-phosphate synthase large subunit
MSAVKKIISVLFLGGGKRVSLAKVFCNVGEIIDTKVELYAYEIDLQQPISIMAEIIEGKEWDAPDVANDILKIVYENKIDIIVSNVDPATVIHSSLRSICEAAAFSSNEKIVEICLSKIKFQKYCENNNIRIIPLAVEDEYPIFGKPSLGSASVGAKLIKSKYEKSIIQSSSEEYIYQKYIKGVEYTVDAYVSRDKKICGISPRIRILTVGGESVISKIIHDTEIVNCSKKIIEKMELIGPITLQYIREQSSNILYLMEVNPRYGGGVLASIKSGYNFPLMMMQEVLGIAPDFVEKGENIIMKRYYQEVFYETSD